MTTPTIDRGRTGQQGPLLPVFAVRAELEPHADLTHFDREVDAAIEHAAATGSFDRLRDALRAWLGIAMTAAHTAELRAVAFEERTAAIAAKVDAWAARHTHG